VRDVAYSHPGNQKLYSTVPEGEFLNHFWQDKNSVTRFQQLESLLSGVVSPAVLGEIGAGLGKVGMSIRLNPYVISLIDWANVETDPSAAVPAVARSWRIIPALPWILSKRGKPRPFRASSTAIPTRRCFS
jgi:hypothetical protein